uniref:Transmembrane protein n=1 Tax=Opuntia streptacantha TaxID=393608 RepID=A0A7C9DNK6_OPUST
MIVHQITAHVRRRGKRKTKRREKTSSFAVDSSSLCFLYTLPLFSAQKAPFFCLPNPLAGSQTRGGILVNFTIFFIFLVSSRSVNFAVMSVSAFFFSYFSLGFSEEEEGKKN